MKALIFGGTTEGRQLSHALADLGADVTVSVATEYGREEQGTHPSVKVLTGRRDTAQISVLLRSADICIDATHPYAKLATENIRTACQATETEYRRLLRPASKIVGGGVVVDSAEQAAQWLLKREGNILLTTGAKELHAFAGLGGKRLYPRVLPLHTSITACEEAGVPHRNIIAMQGPFSLQLNQALLRQFDIRYLVTKDGGEIGGFAAKIHAAEQEGVQAVVISRPEDSGQTIEQILQECEEMMTCR